MKALLLDIDGVLNTSGSCLARTGQKWSQKHSPDFDDLHVELTALIGELPYLVTHTISTIDPTAVELVNRLFVKEPELKLVLSTSHRVLFRGTPGMVYGGADHLKSLSIYMRLLGLRTDVYGVTPVLSGRRGLEAAAYLADHPEIETHCAIDDCADFLPQDCTFQLIDPSVGFTGANYYTVTRHLRINESVIII